MSLRSGEHGRTFVNLLLEVVPVTVGVFLALWANNWHEDREHQALAEATLRNFVGEMEANLQATQRYRRYHETLARELVQFLRSKDPPSEDRFTKEVHFEGVRPVIYEHTPRGASPWPHKRCPVSSRIWPSTSPKSIPSRTPFRP